MITHFDTVPRPKTEAPKTFQWGAALGAGLIAGLVLLIIPRGSPWSTVTFFVPAIVGRVIPDDWNLTLWGSSVIHLMVSLLYGLVVSRVVTNIHEMRAVLTGGVVALGLYLINFGVVSFAFPALRGNELSVLFSHIVFGLIAGGAYRGLLKRQPARVDQ